MDLRETDWTRFAVFEVDEVVAMKILSCGM
jgi:hypothetical protein